MARRSRKGFDEIGSMIAKVRGLETFARDALPAMGRAVSDDSKSNAAKGLAPDGTPWREPTTVSGSILNNAADAINVSTTANAIVLTLTGKYARHHLGIVRGTGPRDTRARRIIPTDEIPKSTNEAMTRAAQAEFRRKLK